MKFKLKKLYIMVIMLAFLAGIIFCGGGFFGLPKNTVINGVPVGGLSHNKAVERVRQSIIDDLKNKKLEICADEQVYTFSYPEISWQDNLFEDIKTIKKSGDYSFKVNYYLNGEDAVISGICVGVNTKKSEPYAIFNKVGDPFTYVGGKNGRAVNEIKLKQDIKNSLLGGFEKISAQIMQIPYEKSLSSIKQNTVLLNAFSTVYDESNKQRSSNIKKACEKINGTVLFGGKPFSFNDIVGERTKENGFLPAKIIEGGRFVDGLGGGVCQVSTTLYNAALLSGCEILEFHPHSLAVGYVPPSRDAMVSGNYFDLRFKGGGETPLYIRAFAKNGKVRCEIYGKSDGANYEFTSVKLREIEPPPPEEVKSEQESIIVKEKAGVESVGFLKVTKNGKTLLKKLREDKYSAVRGVIGVKS